jgi:Ran GTPase-activating protein (RanGAP) involved in mRNA processing and transport
LDLSENPLGDAGVEALANGGGLSSLRELRLSGIGLGARGCAMLALGPWSAGLERLDLSDNALSDEGALALMSGRWGALRRLEVRGGRLSPQAWARLEGELGERGVLVQGP